MKHLFSICISVLLVIAVKGQITIGGKVVDQKGLPLIGANVFIEGSYDGASSDADGLFRFETDPQDSLVVVAQYIGYKSFRQNLDLSSDLSKLSIVLKESFNELKAASITAGAFEAGDSKKAVALKPLDIVTTAGAQGDIMGALQTLPGTSTVGESGRLFVRGGSANETQVYVDGMLVHVPYTNSAPNTAVRGRFNPFIFSGTTFSTGGYSAEYGQALSSVLLLRTKEEAIEDELNIGLMSVGGDLAGTKVWDGGSLTASLGYIDLAPYLSLAPGNVRFSQMPRSTNMSLALKQRVGENGTLKVYANHALSSFGIDYKSPDFNESFDLRGSESNSYLNASFKTTAGQKWVFQTGGAVSLNATQNSSMFFMQDDHTLGEHLKVKATYLAHERVKIHMGSDWFHNQLNTAWGNEQVDSNSLTMDRGALFLEAELFLSNKWAARIGIRGESTEAGNALAQASELSPRSTLAYKINDQSQVSYAFGTFTQDPEQRWLMSGQQLDQEQATHHILNYQVTANERTFRVEAYRKDYDQLVKIATTDSETTLTNDGSGYAQGVDVWFRDQKTIKNGDYWISYSFLDTKRNYLDFPEAAVPTFAATHNLSVVYKHWIGKWRSLVGGALNYSSPRFYNDPNTAEFQQEEIQAIQQLNLNWSFLYRQNIIFYSSMTNVLGQQQSFGRTFAQNPDTSGHFASEEILPMNKRFFFIGCFITLSPNKEKNQLDQLQ